MSAVSLPESQPSQQQERIWLVSLRSKTNIYVSTTHSTLPTQQTNKQFRGEVPRKMWRCTQPAGVQIWFVALWSKTNIYVTHPLRAAPSYYCSHHHKKFQRIWSFSCRLDFYSALIGGPPINQAGLGNIITITILSAAKTWFGQTEAIAVKGECPELRSGAIVVWCRKEVLWICGPM